MAVNSPIQSVRPDIFYIHLLRAIAAIAVIAIHVLGPYRELYGEIASFDFYGAVAINASTRWAVPVFMMISGALLLSTNKPLQAGTYLQRRVGKVVVPFIGWSLIYAMVTGWQAGDWSATWQAIHDSPNQHTWYHLWFFYDFIPLYFVIPLLAPLLKAMTEEQVKILLAAWLTLTIMHLLKVETPLRENLVLYTGYLVLGWYLFNRDNRDNLNTWLMLGLGALVVNWIGSWIFAEAKGAYSPKFMGYKSINTVLIAGMLFVLIQSKAEAVSTSLRKLVVSLSTYSLGIYLMHPLLLIPVRNLDNGVYDWFGTSWIAIPALTLITLALSWVLTAALSKVPVLNKLVP